MTTAAALCGWYLWRNNEEDLSAKCAKAKHEAWFSRSYAHSRWPCRYNPPPPQEPDAALRVIEALSGRRSFERLRAEGMRYGRGRLRLVSRPASDLERIDGVRVGFAVSRQVGNAVQRNRIRRRIRAVLRDIVRDDPTDLPPGDYLFRVTYSIEDWSPTKLRHQVTELLNASLTPTAPDSTAATSGRRS